MKITLLSGSFRIDAATPAVVDTLRAEVRSRGLAVTTADAASLPHLPLLGRDDATGHSALAAFSTTLTDADAVIIVAPVYRASLSGATKALIDFYGDALAGKPVGIVAVAGSNSSLLTVTDFDRALALDLACALHPQRVLVSPDQDRAEVAERLAGFVSAFHPFARALQHATAVPADAA